MIDKAKMESGVLNGMCRKESGISFAAPKWSSRYIPLCRALTKADYLIPHVIEAAPVNVFEQTGMAHLACAFEIGVFWLVCLGEGSVTTHELSILHARMVALILAQPFLHTYRLGGEDLRNHEPAASAEPCAMCFGAIPRSGVRRIICGATSADAIAIGFDEGPEPKNWRDELAARKIAVICEVERERAISVFSGYKNLGGRIYNSRGLNP